MITGIAHVNLTVPAGTLDLAEAFYGTTLGMHSVPVPVLQRSTLAWFDITPKGQQIHIAFGPSGPKSSRHPCFKVGSAEDLRALQTRVWEHYTRGGSSAPQEADKPGGQDSGSQGVEYPTRFFARDYAGNRLEFSM